MTDPGRCSEQDSAHVPCYHARSALRIDGRLDEPAWQKALHSPRFVDSVSGTPAVWVWNRVGSTDNHLPECFTQIHFSDAYVEDL